jgi:hypothetical protein
MRNKITIEDIVLQRGGCIGYLPLPSSILRPLRLGVKSPR